MRFIVISLSILLAIILTGLATNKKPLSPTNEVYKNFLIDYEKFEQSLFNFNEVVLSENSASLLKNYFSLRYAFKSIEPLLCYYVENEYNLYFNGAPLPKLEPNVPEVVVLPPTGMQIIDELIVQPKLNFEALQKQTENLIDSTKKTKKILKGISCTDRHLLEACRAQLVRTFSLGLSGFDTPGTNNFLQDAISVNHSIIKIMDHFKSIMHANDTFIFDLLSEFNLILKNEINNDRVDYIELTKKYINPLYKAIKKFHLSSGIEHSKEVSDQPAPLNYYADNIFANDFLNHAPFSKIHSLDESEAKVKLGKILFFDPILSISLNQSCASCHNPKLAFTDGKIKSITTQNKNVINRNTPTLINSIYSTKFFYDMRSPNLDLQIDHVIYNKDEFNIDYAEIIKRLENSKEYMQLFKNAYTKNEDIINRYTITNALTQYVTNLSSFNSNFDKYMRNEVDTINKNVYAGFNLFMGKAACATCHFAPVFNGTVPPAFKESESEILGTLATNDFDNPVLDNDPGRSKNGDLRQDSEIYFRSFKTPTIRNVALTAPYMHNGVHNTLQEVIAFYNIGGGAGMGLKVPYQTLAPDSLGLTELESRQLINFLEALTDTINLTSIPKKLPKILGYENRIITY